MLQSCRGTSGASANTDSSYADRGPRDAGRGLCGDHTPSQHLRDEVGTRGALAPLRHI